VNGEREAAQATPRPREPRRGTRRCRTLGAARTGAGTATPLEPRGCAQRLGRPRVTGPRGRAGGRGATPGRGHERGGWGDHAAGAGGRGAAARRGHGEGVTPSGELRAGVASEST
jgi:hypothetical protein